jgi:defect-in-organelle-trafficking protein DotD
MNKRFSICFMLITLLALSACSDRFRDATPQLVAEPDNVSALLASAADRAANSLEKLAAVEYAKTSGVAVGPVTDAPTELRRAISVEWVGPVEQITQVLADRASYNFLIVGASPPVPLVVDLDIENMPVVEVLRNIGLQMGQRADIRIDAPRRSIEIHYAPVDGAEG